MKPRVLKSIMMGLAVLVVSVGSARAASYQATANDQDKAASSSTSAESQPKNSSTAANPSDVKTVDGIMAAVYDVISGPSGPRNWDRFHSLFLPQATLATVEAKPGAAPELMVVGPDGYIKLAQPYFDKEGFFENEIGRRSEAYGAVTHVWSTYASRHTKDGNPFERGINSFQLVNDGERWWVLSILWDSERKGNVIPGKYLKTVREK